MRLIAILCWFDESPSWLAATTASLAGVADHLVACDGSYALYPHPAARSAPEQTEAIVEVASAVGLGLTLHHPMHPWLGNEVEKRTYAFRLAEQAVAYFEDWYLVIDADEVVTSGHVRDLEHTDEDCAAVTLWARTDPHETEAKANLARSFDWNPVTQGPVRRLFRAIPGLRVEGNHYTYRTPDGTVLWGNPGQAVETEQTTTLKLEHRHDHRDLHRANLQRDYYMQRDLQHQEHGLLQMG